MMVLIVQTAQSDEFEPDISQPGLRNPVAIRIDRAGQFERDALVFGFQESNANWQIAQATLGATSWATLGADLGAKQVCGSHFVEPRCPNDLTLPQDADLVAQTFDLAEDVRAKHDGRTLLMDLLDQIDDGETDRGVQVFSRFIENHQGARAAQDAANR